MGLEIEISRLEFQLMLLPKPLGEAVGCTGMQKHVQRVWPIQLHHLWGWGGVGCKTAKAHMLGLSLSSVLSVGVVLGKWLHF